MMTMDIVELIEHPERLDRDTLYELRSMVALYPYFQSARLLMLQNLNLLHDPSFDEELRRAAIYITDRSMLFQMIEAAHYQLRKPQPAKPAQPAAAAPAGTTAAPAAKPQPKGGNRTLTLIDSFLDSIPKEEEPQPKGPKRKPTPADAAIDYVAYLLESETENEQASEVPQLIGQDLIDTFINNDKKRIILNEEPEYKPELDEQGENGEEESNEGYFTETLARIYIKQGRYSKALEIIQRLSLQYPKKNAYFADQIRFLEKLIINNNKK
jgi:hypothetical protein